MKTRTRNKVVAWVLLAVLTATNVFSIPGNTMETQAAELPGLGDVTREVAAEGIVLLENEDQVLPLETGEEVSVFGRIQVDTFYCGYGSGGYVYPTQKTSILEGLRQNPGIEVNEELAGIYEEWCKAHPEKGNDAGWAQWPRYFPEMSLTDEQVGTAADKTQKAIVIIGRSAGEDRECLLQEGSYYLTQDEKKLLGQVNAKFDDVIVLLNIGNIIDMEWMNDYDHIKAVLNVWQGGMQMGKAVADVLSGDVNPSGKLASTIAKTYNDYPSSGNFGASAYNNYAEDIFVGYRYFETFEDAKDKVLYPFGFGLSYTDFEIETTGVETVGDQIKVSVNVTNTGDRAGKEVVQVYYGAPQGMLGKAAKSLAAYAKTPLLQPDESRDMTMTFDISSMASYDDSGKTGNKSCFVLEEGDYPIYVGNSVRDASKQGVYEQKNLQVTEKLEEAVAPEVSFDIMTASEGKNGEIVQGTEKVSMRTEDLKTRIEDNLPEEITPTGDQGHQLLDVYQEKVTLDAFIAQMSDDALARIARGAGGMQSSLGNPGNAGVFGGVDGTLRDMGIVPVSAHDGPSGLRLRETDASSLLPIGSLLACTWNNELVEYVYSLLGEEMILSGVDILLAPGMNIHRDPLCGRNFEYFSEDPLVTGMMGAATVRGVQASGAGVCLKHFSANNQETNRKNTDSRVSERAMREIYLKAFEIAVKTSNPISMMSAYNKLNGVWCCYNYELMTTILREQWGYDGVIMTDWSMQSATSPYNANVKDNAYRVQAQVDLYMPGDFSTNSIMNALGNGLTRGELQRSVKNILNCVMKTPKFAKDNALEYWTYEKPEAYYQTTGADVVDGKSARLTSIAIDGKNFSNFNPLMIEYSVFHKPSDTMPVVSAEASEGVEVQVTQATKDRPIAVIEVKDKANGASNTYRISFVYGLDMTPTVENPVYAYLNNIYLDGESLPGFYGSMYDYEVIVSKIPEITVDEKAGVTTTITYAKDGSGADILAESADHAVQYHITFAQGPKSDDFEGNTLQNFWTHNAKNGNAFVADGALTIRTEAGDLYQTDKDLKNYISQPAYGDWEAVTKIQLSEMLSQQYHQAGIKIMQDEDNYLYFRLEQANTSGAAAIRLTEEKNGKVGDSLYQSTTQASKIQENNNTFYLKVVKSQKSYSFYVSADGENYDTAKEEYIADYAEPKYTLAATKGTGKDNIPTIDVSYDYVHFTMKAPEMKVIDVKKDRDSRLKVAEDFYSKSSTLTPQPCDDEGNGLNMGYSAPGEWALYSINVEEAGYYQVSPRIASDRDDLYQLSFGLEVDARPLTTFMQLGGTGGWQNWQTMDPKPVYLDKGEHKLKLYYLSDGININWLEFSYMQPYTVTVDKTEGVEVLLDKEITVAGETVSFTVICGEGQELVSVSVAAGEDSITLKQRADGSYYFEMPENNVKVTVEATALPQKPGLPAASLASAVEEAKKVGLSNYTAESVTAFQAALKRAEEVLNNPNALPSEIEAALKALSAAKAALAAPLKKDDKFSVSDIEYQVTKSDAANGTVTVSKISAKNSTVTIPTVVKDKNGVSYNVTAIANNASAKNSKVKTLVIGENITNIGAKSFYNCKNLKKITFKGKNLPKFGKNAFKGIKKNCKVFVNKKMPKKQFDKLKKQLQKMAGKKISVKQKKV